MGLAATVPDAGRRHGQLIEAAEQAFYEAKKKVQPDFLDVR